MLLKGTALFLLINILVLVSGKKETAQSRKTVEKPRVIEGSKVCNDIRRYSLSPKEVDKHCEKPWNIMHKIPHPDDCSAYFECRGFYDEDNIPPYFTSKYMRVCPYPQLYLVLGRTRGECRDPMQVERQACGRTIPKSPCDYLTYRCFKGHCPPCEVMFPSCVGEPDGYRLIIGEISNYKECRDGRTVGTRKKSCRGSQIFDSRRRTCQDIVERQKPKKI